MEEKKFSPECNEFINKLLAYLWCNYVNSTQMLVTTFDPHVIMIPYNTMVKVLEKFLKEYEKMIRKEDK